MIVRALCTVLQFHCVQFHCVCVCDGIHRMLLFLFTSRCREEYFRMKQQWQTLSETQVKHFTSYRECSSLISESGAWSGVILVE